ncbi:esterase-like activity of phytase family protein [Sphingomonas ginsenosidivorax]|uniref:Esterase-like activity of phytase family protein n=1 Tax=Sphingomonas ginsenosidivorax TaxID=862135 RepID=A0A5C6UHY0_9SPHN|nr:esterase-like activity of phytase family protein [Sphingomonas ginsenosidivorax]TXC71816.1 esterase-like activity of phytase family protein [Sphingomonas ginsenosidivorax]
MRRPLTLLLVAGTVLAIAPGWTGEVRLPLLGRAANLSVAPVALDEGDSARTTVGALTFLGGVHLTSRDPAFGGYSSLAVAGDRFILLSDGGNAVSFRMGADWRPADIGFRNLPGGPGEGWQKADRDSESMAIDPRTGTIWAGFEGANAIWRYASGFARVEGHVAPTAMAKWDVNGGAESLARLHDGRFLTISETTRGPRVAVPRRRGRQALIFAGDPLKDSRPAVRFTYMPPNGYDPSDATELPDGRLLVLNRAFSLPFVFTSILVLIDPREVREGATVTGRAIATLAPPLIHDNFEGVAATRGTGRDAGATMLWLVSDDNQAAPLERTLLLKFRLNG